MKKLVRSVSRLVNRQNFARLWRLLVAGFLRLCRGLAFVYFSLLLLFGAWDLGVFFGNFPVFATFVIASAWVVRVIRQPNGDSPVLRFLAEVLTWTTFVLFVDLFIDIAVYL